jgi:hypothetical protein
MLAPQAILQKDREDNNNSKRIIQTILFKLQLIFFTIMLKYGHSM